MKAGQGAGYFIADLANNVSDAKMRERWLNGEYGGVKDRPTRDMVLGFRRMAGRESRMLSR